MTASYDDLPVDVLKKMSDDYFEKNPFQLNEEGGNLPDIEKIKKELKKLSKKMREKKN